MSDQGLRRLAVEAMARRVFERRDGADRFPWDEAPVEMRCEWEADAEAALDSLLDTLTAEGYDCLDHSSRDLWFALRSPISGDNDAL